MVFVVVVVVVVVDVVASYFSLQEGIELESNRIESNQIEYKLHLSTGLFH